MTAPLSFLLIATATFFACTLFFSSSRSNLQSAMSVSRCASPSLMAGRMGLSVPRNYEHRGIMTAHSQALATSELTPVEIIESNVDSDGKQKTTFGFRITGNDKKPLIQMTMESKPNTELIPVTVGFPGLGVILEQKVLDDGPCIVVDDKEDAGSAVDVLQVGDVLRAFSAVYTVTPPTDTLAFYANPPRKVNVRGMFEVDGKNFAKTIAALKSNGELIDRFGEKMEVNEISIVVERKKQ
eukprot:CAMPEP_0184485218 /NCGR_PEP_ID=MMETSP0113_2-20130426/6850_1 /TAXON_ID=91329 /ORGANISM="Norrisiella sphaerica, Strain BC52" /LENGTH=239 /DNA_ID=CAMNT_0026866571 /DNA_START=57 /DNA_END=776 /DNA_ORIENTATION=+